MPQLFATPEDYISRFGIMETGQLLNNAGTIDSAADTLAGYTAAMYLEGVLIDAVATKLAQIIAESQATIEAMISEAIAVPLTISSVEILTSEMEEKAPLIFFACLDIARWILHDEDIQTIQDSSSKSSVQIRYEKAFKKMEAIANEEFDIPNIDTNNDSSLISWAI